MARLVLGEIDLRIKDGAETMIAGKFEASVDRSKRASKPPLETTEEEEPPMDEEDDMDEAMEPPEDYLTIEDLRDDCINEIGILCSNTKSDTLAVKCLRKNKSGLLKTCRRSLKQFRW